MAEVRISAESAASATALTGWLRRDPSVARAGITIEPMDAPASPATAMGSVDTITAVANSTVGLLGLLVTTAAWRRPRGVRKPTVRITERDGTVLEGTAEDVLSILRAREEREQSDA
ncbi:effector-associated constant component EACC1 [Streptomyces sp. YS-3]|uniref:effector-associated constant component EACC1 n=1 Tax=Streptomyces sp. YS-3 TaxID=3381352 RepID=UPI0038625D14